MKLQKLSRPADPGAEGPLPRNAPQQSTQTDGRTAGDGTVPRLSGEAVGAELGPQLAHPLA